MVSSTRTWLVFVSSIFRVPSEIFLIDHFSNCLIINWKPVYIISSNEMCARSSAFERHFSRAAVFTPFGIPVHIPQGHFRLEDLAKFAEPLLVSSLVLAVLLLIVFGGSWGSRQNTCFLPVCHLALNQSLLNQLLCDVECHCLMLNATAWWCCVLKCILNRNLSLQISLSQVGQGIFVLTLTPFLSQGATRHLASQCLLGTAGSCSCSPGTATSSSSWSLSQQLSAEWKLTDAASKQWKTHWVFARVALQDLVTGGAAGGQYLSLDSSAGLCSWAVTQNYFAQKISTKQNAANLSNSN